MRIYKTIPAKEKFDGRYIPVTETGCWLWLGGLNHNGYGQFGHQGKCIRAHRFSWEQANGPIPNGMLVCHKCDTPSCVNPDHLFLGTTKENAEDMVRKCRPSKGFRLSTAQGNQQRCGMRHHYSIFTDEQIPIIRNDPRSAAKIARELGVSKTAIQCIKSRTTWRHIPETSGLKSLAGVIEQNHAKDQT